jgi:hypothetical protein
MHSMIIGNILLGNILLLRSRGAAAEAAAAHKKKAASGICDETKDSLLYKFLSFSPELCMLEDEM